MPGSISAVDSMYFNNAFNSPNIAFMGAQQNAQAQMQAYQQMLRKYEAAADATRVDNSSAVASNMAFKGKAKTESDNTALYVAGALAAATYAGYCIYTKQKPIKAAKTLFGKAKNLITGKGGSVSDKIKAVMTDDGLKYIIDGKNTTIAAKDIADFASKNGIDTEALQKITKGVTQLKGGSFVLEDGGIKNLVTFADGKVTGLRNLTEGKNIIDIFTKPEGKEQIEFVEKINKQLSKIINQESGYKDGLRRLTYSNTIGENTLTFAQKFNGSGTATTTMKNLVTPTRFTPDSDAVKAFFYDHKNWADAFKIVDGKLPKGLKIESFTYNYDLGRGASVPVLIKNGNIAGITKDGEFFSSLTDECKAFLSDNEKALKTSVENFLKDGKIPQGATLVRA